MSGTDWRQIRSGQGRSSNVHCSRSDSAPSASPNAALGGVPPDGASGHSHDRPQRGAPSAPCRTLGRSGGHCWRQFCGEACQRAGADPVAAAVAAADGTSAGARGQQGPPAATPPGQTPSGATSVTGHPRLAHAEHGRSWLRRIPPSSLCRALGQRPSRVPALTPTRLAGISTGPDCPSAHLPVGPSALC